MENFKATVNLAGKDTELEFKRMPLGLYQSIKKKLTPPDGYYFALHDSTGDIDLEQMDASFAEFCRDTIVNHEDVPACQYLHREEVYAVVENFTLAQLAKIELQNYGKSSNPSTPAK